MPWPGKPTVKDIFGMEDTEFKTKLDAGEAASSKVTALETNVNTRFDELVAMIKGLENKPATQQTQQSQQQQQTQQGDVKAETMPSFLDDEDGAFNARAQKFMGPIAQMTLQTNAKFSFETVRNRHAKDFNLFLDEIKTELAKAPLAYQANEDYVENAYNMIKGRHADEIAEHTAKREGRYFVEGVTTSGNQLPGQQTKTGPQLNDDELKYCGKFGISPEEYAKTKGSLKYV